MTFRPLACALVALAALASTGAARAQAPANAPTPAQMATNLQNLQARIAQGDLAAQAAQPAALRAMAVVFADAKPDFWSQEDNRYAIIAYLLSGGSPGVILRAVESGEIPQNATLIQGALAYVLGHQREADSLLAGVDASKLDLRLAGQVAFIQSVLTTGQDKVKAIHLLDLARLLAPGGLVEEAALRREILLAGETRDVDRFAILSRDYITRFPRSLYAVNFMSRFPTIVVRMHLAESIENFHKFDNLRAALTAGERRNLDLAIARGALLNGKIDVATLASQTALQDGDADPFDATRGRLYQAGAMIMTAQYDRGVAELRALDAKALDARDRTLLSVIRNMAVQLRTPTATGPQPPPPKTPPTSQTANDPATSTITLAETAMTNADSLLTEKTP